MPTSFKKTFFITLLNSILLLAGFGTLVAQDFEPISLETPKPPPSNSYLQEPVSPRPFDRNAWKQVTSGTDFSERVEPEENSSGPKRQDSNYHGSGNGSGSGSSSNRSIEDDDYTPRSSSSSSSIWKTGGGGVLQVLFYIIIIVALAALIWYVVVGAQFRSNKKVGKTKPTYTIENMDENIHESDLDRFLREALAAQQYRLAIRIYYLTILRRLSEKSLIQWKRDKTNNAYLREMRPRPEFLAFRDCTNIYERIWYGNTDFSLNDYQFVKSKFDTLLKTLG